MLKILRAYARAVRSLFLPGVLRHFLWPVLAAIGVWLVLGIVFWARLSHADTERFRFSKLASRYDPHGFQAWV